MTQTSLTPVTAPFAQEIADKAAALIWSVDPHYNEIVFGQDKQEGLSIIKGLWLLAKGSASHTNATALMRGPELLGIEIGAGPGRNESVEKEANIYMGKNASLALLARLKNLQDYLGYTMVDVPPTAYYLAVIALTPDARGQGHAKHLIENTYARAIERGCKSIHADVYANNSVVDMYRHWGFSVLVETRIPYLAEAHSLAPELRMVKKL